MKRTLAGVWIATVVVAGAAAQQGAPQPYEFAAAPHQGLNRIYRVDRATGEMGACQYGLKDGSIGITVCYPAGEGAKAQGPAEFGLMASSHQSEAGIFRLNRRTGEISVCYVMNDEHVVCTPQAK